MFAFFFQNASTVQYCIMSASLRNFATRSAKTFARHFFSKHPTSPGTGKNPGSELWLSNLRVMINIEFGQVGGKTLGGKDELTGGKYCSQNR